MTDEELTADAKWCPECGSPREACVCQHSNETTVPDPVCANCGSYLSGETCDKCGLDQRDSEEVRLYKLFRKWRGTQKRASVVAGWRAGYEISLTRAEKAEAALDVLQRRIDTLIGVTCKRCEAGDKLFVEPDTGFYTHTLGGNYCSAHKLHSLLNTPQSQIARALKS